MPVVKNISCSGLLKNLFAYFERSFAITGLDLASVSEVKNHRRRPLLG
jgi:hypothetical protein